MTLNIQNNTKINENINTDLFSYTKKKKNNNKNNKNKKIKNQTTKILDN